MSLVAEAEALYRAALYAVNGRRVVSAALVPLSGPVWVLGAGKAAASMARGALDVLGDQIVGGLISVKDGHGQPGLAPIEVWTAGHPDVDDRSLRAGAELLRLARARQPTDLVLGLWSGGASALAEALAPSVTLAGLQREVRELNAQGAPIHALNALRIQRSALKGGRLREASRARWLNLVLSDVAGDDPAWVGSGPGISSRVESETQVVGTLRQAVRGLVAEAEHRGWGVVTMANEVGGPAAEAGAEAAQAVNEFAGTDPTCLVWSGEPTVALGAASGRGGRMQEAAMAAALALRRKACVLWFAGTDGTDGPTDAAGAWVDADTAAACRASGFSPARALAEHDAYAALDAVGRLVRVGPTGTNVRDVWFALIR